jgi:hypothetical protein
MGHAVIYLNIKRPVRSSAGQLGSLPNSRRVTLTGTTTVNALFNSSIFPIENWLKIALVNAQFEVVAVRYNWLSSLPFGGNAINFEIELDVYNQYTSDQARDNAIAAIEAYTANYGLNKVFSNTVVNVSYDAYVPPGTVSPGTRDGSGNTNSSGSTPGGIKNPPSQYDQTGKATPSTEKSSLQKMLESLGADLGFGAAGALVGGAAVAGIFLLVLLKK